MNAQNNSDYLTKADNAKKWFLELGFSGEKYSGLKNEFGQNFPFILITFQSLIEEINDDRIDAHTDLVALINNLCQKNQMALGTNLNLITVARQVRKLLDDWILIQINLIEQRINELDALTIEALYYQTQANISEEILNSLSSDDRSVLIYAVALSEEFIVDDPRFTMPIEEFNEAVDFYIRKAAELYRKLHNVPEDQAFNFKAIRIAFASKWDPNNLYGFSDVF